MPDSPVMSAIVTQGTFRTHTMVFRHGRPARPGSFIQLRVTWMEET